MQETSFESSSELTPEEMEIYRDKVFEMAKLFDRPGQKVITELPAVLKLEEVIGFQHYPDKTTKITFRRFQTLFLCWIPTSKMAKHLERFNKAISDRKEWDERWEPWEIYGSTEPWELKKRLLHSRLRNQRERDEYDLFYR